MSNLDNNGLEPLINELQDFVEDYDGTGLTRADIWMLSALVATEIALEDDADGLDLSLRWFGRKTCDDMFGGPPRELCHGVAGTSTVRNFFADEFGFDDRQVVAIMGAHSVGRMRQENVGNVGRWDLTRNRLDNGYFLELTRLAPQFELVPVDNSDFRDIPDTWQWEGTTDDGTVITMLNADMALVRNVPDAEEVDCVFDSDDDNRCSRNTPFHEHVATYMRSRRTFQRDFVDVLNLLIDHGGVKGDNCIVGEQDLICKFD